MKHEMSITVTSPMLSPSLDEYGPATITDENAKVIPVVAYLIPDSNGNTGSSIYTIDNGFTSPVTDRVNPPMAHTHDGKRIPVMALVTLDASANVIPLSVITALQGEATASGPGSATVTLSNPAVIGKVLTGYTKGAGVVSAADTIIGAIQKLDGNRNIPIITRRASATNTNFSATDAIVSITDTSAVRTVTLDLASTFADGQMLEIKDESGAAGTNNITIAVSGSDTIDGASSLTISANYGVARLYVGGGKFYTR